MKLLKRLWFAGAFLYALVFITSCFSHIISPYRFVYISFLALTFPFIFIGQVIIGFISLFINRKAGVILLLLLAFAYTNVRHSFAFNFNSHFDTVHAPQTIRVMTWNVLYFLNNSKVKENNKRLEMLSLIKSYDPDVMCFQDYTGYENVNDIADVQQELKEMGYPYKFITESQSNGNGTLYVGVAIYSKWPLLNQQKLMIDTTNLEFLARADLVKNGDTINVNTAHLRSYALYADTSGTHSRLGNYKIVYQRKRTFVKKIRDVEKEHAEQVVMIKQAMSTSTHPVIFCGDINSTPASYTYSKLSAGLKDVFVEKGKYFGGTYFGVSPTLRIDVCLVDKRFDVLQWTTDQHRFSDHKAVIADLRLKNDR